MNKKILTGIISLLLIATIPLAVGQQDDESVVIEESSDIKSQNILGAALIAGYIYNPQVVGFKTHAKAIALAYYEPGLLFKDQGISIGFKDIQFRPGNLFYMSEQNQLGLVLVAGMVTGFKIDNGPLNPLNPLN